MSHSEKALEFHAQGYNCAQAVLMAFSEDLGLSIKDAQRMVAAYGGGMGCGEICGTVSSALMILGMQKFNTSADSPEKINLAKSDIRTESQHFMTRFKERNSSVICREILARGGKPLCRKAISDACDILDEML